MDISVIMPYYNAGVYLPEAIKSVRFLLSRKDIQCEIVIVNDGSTDELSIEVLKKLESEKQFTIIHQENKGPAAARNNAVKHSKGRYLLFLDSDNKIRPALVEKGLQILDSNEGDIVYGNAQFFGDSSKPMFKPGPLNVSLLVARNYIDMCALVCREVWEKTGGFDENEKLRKGQEDWDLWLRAVKAGFKFYYIDEVVFDYRVRKVSLTNADTEERYYTARKYIYEKHPDLVLQAFLWVTDELYFYQQDQQRPFRSFIKNLYHKYIK